MSKVKQSKKTTKLKHQLSFKTLISKVKQDTNTEEENVEDQPGFKSPMSKVKLNVLDATGDSIMFQTSNE